MALPRHDKYNPLGYEQITGLSTAKALTVPTGARKAQIQAEDQDVRYRDDGTDPTATVGMVLASGADLWYEGDLDALSFIEATTGATLNVSYYA